MTSPGQNPFDQGQNPFDPAMFVRPAPAAAAVRAPATAHALRRDPSQHCGKYTRISTLPPGQVGSVPNVPV